MVKSEQALILDPPVELHFRAPFDEVVTSYLKLTNPTDQRIVFKIKTTAPKTYCVRPNYGIIIPKQTITVSLMLQPVDFETAEKSKHKFMVQSIYARDGEDDVETLWNETPPEKYMNSKLVCVFDSPPSEQAVVDGSGDRNKSSSEVLKANIASEPVLEEKEPNPEEDPQSLKHLQDLRKEFTSEVMKLRQENSALKEESLRMRLSRPASEEPSAPSALPQTKPTTPKPVQKNERSLPFHFYLICILVLIAGVYLGRSF